MNTAISCLQANAAKASLENDLQAVIDDTEILLQLTANQGSESIQALRGKAEKSLAAAKVKMMEAHEALMEKPELRCKPPIVMSMRSPGTPLQLPPVPV